MSEHVDPRFPGAPPEAYITEEGWLVIGDQAWTPEEWNGPHGFPARRRWRNPQEDDER